MKRVNMIEIKQISPDKQNDANIPNQPFKIWGKMIPSLHNGKWNYQIEEFLETTEMCFPDCLYDINDDDSIFYGAYDGDKCIGVAVLRKGIFKYLYLDDLKIDVKYRRQGVGTMLIKTCLERAKSENMKGIYTIGQDNNLSACLFYIHQGFKIGGFDNKVYQGTSQEGKADIVFYLDS